MLLSFDLAKSIEFFLLKAESSAEIPAHKRKQDGVAYIIDDTAHFENLKLNVEGFHFAPKGNHHSNVKYLIGA